MKNTNQQDRNDPHNITKLVEKELDQTDNQLAKYGQNSEQTSAETVQRTCPALNQICPVSPDISGKIAGYVRSTQKHSSQL
jgi:hypothetical protein